MADYFALLDLPRRPWLASELVQQQFLNRSTEVHPDRFRDATEPARTEANQRFTELNRAWQTLRDPRERLRHFLELHGAPPGSSIQQLSSAQMDLALEIGRLVQQAGRFIEERDKNNSPMIKAASMERALEWFDQIERSRAKLTEREQALQRELEELSGLALPREKGKKESEELMPRSGERGGGERLGVGVGVEERAQVLGRLTEIYQELSYLQKAQQQLQERAIRLL